MSTEGKHSLRCCPDTNFTEEIKTVVIVAAAVSAKLKATAAAVVIVVVAKNKANELE